MGFFHGYMGLSLTPPPQKDTNAGAQRLQEITYLYGAKLFMTNNFFYAVFTNVCCPCKVISRPSLSRTIYLSCQEKILQHVLPDRLNSAYSA